MLIVIDPILLKIHPDFQNSAFSMFFHVYTIALNTFWLPRWLSGKESSHNAGDTGLIPGSGRSPEGGHGNPLQCSCLENPKDRGAWLHWVNKSLKQLKQLSLHAHAYPLTVTLSPLCPIKFSVPWNSIMDSFIFQFSFSQGIDVPTCLFIIYIIHDSFISSVYNENQYLVGLPLWLSW